jgi:hypothetical protein
MNLFCAGFALALGMVYLSELALEHGRRLRADRQLALARGDLDRIFARHATETGGPG